MRYIKLGKGGVWEQEALKTGTLPVWYRAVEHQSCIEQDWDRVSEELRIAGRKKGKLTDGVRELRDFYTLDEQCLWVTISAGYLWWAFASLPVQPVDEPGDDRPARLRHTVDGWHCHDLAGRPLSLDRLSTSLTQIAGYRGTICTIQCEDYLLRKIRGEPEPLVAEAEQIRQQLVGLAARMIAALHWRDFEIMVDLIFARGGWHRQSALGKGEVDRDLLLLSPTTGERAFVQIKSRANQKVLNDYLDRFDRSGAERFFFVCHSPTGPLSLANNSSCHIWTGMELGSRALGAGLFDWLIERTG